MNKRPKLFEIRYSVTSPRSLHHKGQLPKDHTCNEDVQCSDFSCRRQNRHLAVTWTINSSFQGCYLYPLQILGICHLDGLRRYMCDINNVRDKICPLSMFKGACALKKRQKLENKDNRLIDS